MTYEILKYNKVQLYSKIHRLFKKRKKFKWWLPCSQGYFRVIYKVMWECSHLVTGAVRIYHAKGVHSYWFTLLFLQIRQFDFIFGKHSFFSSTAVLKVTGALKWELLRILPVDPWELKLYRSQKHSLGTYGLWNHWTFCPVQRMLKKGPYNLRELNVII